jgi:hypothetical protein
MVVEEQRTRRAGPGGYAKSLEDLAAEFEFWWSQGRRFVIRGWNVKAFQTLVGADRCDGRDREDLNLLVHLSQRCPSPSALFGHSGLRKMIREREHQKRPGKCRLCGSTAHRKYLRQWGAPPKRMKDPFQLQFRHHVGDTIVRDILRQEYERRGDVQD